MHSNLCCIIQQCFTIHRYASRPKNISPFKPPFHHTYHPATEIMGDKCENYQPNAPVTRNPVLPPLVLTLDHFARTFHMQPLVHAYAYGCPYRICCHFRHDSLAREWTMRAGFSRQSPETEPLPTRAVRRTAAKMSSDLDVKTALIASFLLAISKRNPKRRRRHKLDQSKLKLPHQSNTDGEEDKVCAERPVNKGV
jgi:hypothetical protein